MFGGEEGEGNGELESGGKWLVTWCGVCDVRIGDNRFSISV